MLAGYGIDVAKKAYDILNTLGIVFAFVYFVIVLTWQIKDRTKDLKEDAAKRERRELIKGFSVCYPVAIAGLFVGPRILGRLMFPDRTGAVAYVGGVILAIMAFWVTSLFLPKIGNPFDQMNYIGPAFALHQTFNRLACSVGICCHGIPWRYGMIYPDIARACEKYGIGTQVFPAPQLEAGLMFVIFIVLLIMLRKKKHSEHIFPIYFGIVGYLLEFMVGDDRGVNLFGLFNLMQVAYLALIVIGIFFYFIVRNNTSREKMKNEGQIKPVKA